jgi:DNA invertase Pin-like site-specific DNA recombinase
MLAPPGRKFKGAGYAPQVVKHFADVARPGLRVALYCRESGRSQAWQGHLTHQVVHLRRLVRSLGADVVKVFKVVGSGSKVLPLMNALSWCRKHGAVLVAESTARLLRAHDYTPKEPDRQPSEPQWQLLGQLAEGVTVCSWLDPSATPQQIRAFEAKRGLMKDRRWKKKPGQKTQRRKRLLPVVLELASQGMSKRQIALRLGVSRSLVTDWLRVGEKC